MTPMEELQQKVIESKDHTINTLKQRVKGLEQENRMLKSKLYKNGY